MTIIATIAFLIWLASACVLALDIALPKMQPIQLRVRARLNHRRRRSEDSLEDII